MITEDQWKILKRAMPAVIHDATHDAASQKASNICNQSLEDQVNFITEVCGWSAEDLLRYIEGWMEV